MEPPVVTTATPIRSSTPGGVTLVYPGSTEINPTEELELEKDLLGQRGEPLNAVEINRLMSRPRSPEFVLLLETALRNQRLNPDMVLVQIIAQGRKQPRADIVIPFALTLRSGANPNMYLRAPGRGVVHILGYLYLELGHVAGGTPVIEERTLNTLVLLLIMRGSLPSLPMYDERAGAIPRPGSPTYGTARVTVEQWLTNQGYVTILPQLRVTPPPQGLSPETQRMLGLLLDRVDLLYSSGLSRFSPRVPVPLEDREKGAVDPSTLLSPNDTETIIRSFDEVLLKYISPPTRWVMMDSVDLENSVKYLNSRAFAAVMDKGANPSFLLMNKILNRMGKYRAEGRIIPYQALEGMVLAAVTRGYQLNPSQNATLETFGEGTKNAVQKAYATPYWKKTCSTDGPLTLQLQRLALSLDIDPTRDKKSICQALEALAGADPKALEEATIKRQRARLQANLSLPTEFIGQEGPPLVCTNHDLLPYDPLELSDYEVAVYRDDQGQAWCFPRTLYDSLLDSKVNPYTLRPLPPLFLQQVQTKNEVLQRLGVEGEPRPFSENLKSLNTEDRVTSDLDTREMARFRVAATAAGVGGMIDTLNANSIVQILNALGFQVDSTNLTNIQARQTLARVGNYLGRVDPPTQQRLFQLLRGQSVRVLQ